MTTRLTVVAGPTAVGKGTVVRDLCSRYGGVWVSCSATTRPPRPGEVDGEHYSFVSEEEFDDLIARNQMLEWATVHGRYRYGTPRRPVEARLEQGIAVLLEIDLDGARQIRNTMPTARLVFLAPPSQAELERRLLGRGTEDEAERARRLETARAEMAAIGEFSAVIVNDDVTAAADQLAHLMGLSRL
ncbi:MAG: guanylate kinase [Promicromonosporaceae bacterium]|nr:guanylate kinase [Promicromonosporaceae bacterium]